MPMVDIGLGADDQATLLPLQGRPSMNASVSALIFVGLLLTVLGLLVAGSLALIALGIAALIGAGLFQAIASRAV
jgi:hypothetical protein